MAMDLVISDNGKVMIASTQPLRGSVARVDFDAVTGMVSLAFDEADTPDHLLPLPVSNRLMTRVLQASRVLLVTLDHGRINGGYDVPLTCTGTV